MTVSCRARAQVAMLTRASLCAEGSPARNDSASPGRQPLKSLLTWWSFTTAELEGVMLALTLYPRHHETVAGRSRSDDAVTVSSSAPPLWMHAARFRRWRGAPPQ